MNPTLKRLLPVFVLCSLAAHAATISYTDNGTFTTSTATSAFSGSGKAWTFAFLADSHPTVSDVGMGGFDFAFSNFSYLLGGSPVAIMPSFIRFFSAANGGGFLICFNGMTAGTCTDGLGSPLFGQPQMYTGTTAAPTLLTGALNITSFAAVVNSNVFGQPNTTVLATDTFPEPSTLLTVAAGFLVLGWRHLYRRPDQRRSRNG